MPSSLWIHSRIHFVAESWKLVNGLWKDVSACQRMLMSTIQKSKSSESRHLIINPLAKSSSTSPRSGVFRESLESKSWSLRVSPYWKSLSTTLTAITTAFLRWLCHLGMGLQPHGEPLATPPAVHWVQPPIQVQTSLRLVEKFDLVGFDKMMVSPDMAGVGSSS